MTRFQVAFMAAGAMLGLCAFPVAAQDALAYCTEPGELVTEDPVGDALLVAVPDPLAQHDVEAVYFAEPDGMTDTLLITLKAVSLDPEAAPNSIFYVNFLLDNGTQYFVSFRRYVLPDPVPNQMDFAYGHLEPDTTGATAGTFVTDGPVEGRWEHDGRITWVLPRSLIPGLAPGTDVANIVGEARVIVGSPFSHPVQPPPPAPRVPGGFVVVVDESPAGFYTLSGNDSCAADGKAGFIVGAGSPPLAVLLLLSLAALRRRSR